MTENPFRRVVTADGSAHDTSTTEQHRSVEHHGTDEQHGTGDRYRIVEWHRPVDRYRSVTAREGVGA